MHQKPSAVLGIPLMWQYQSLISGDHILRIYQSNNKILKPSIPKNGMNFLGMKLHAGGTSISIGSIRVVKTITLSISLDTKILQPILNKF